jgi:hypothetical protein
MHQAANIAPLDAAFNELPNFIGKYGMGGGSRKGRKGRKASRKGRKASRKGRKASRKNRKASRKNRKASRKGRKASRKNRKASRKASRKQRGGMAPVGAPSMILTPAEEPAATRKKPGADANGALLTGFEGFDEAEDEELE